MHKLRSIILAAIIIVVAFSLSFRNEVIKKEKNIVAAASVISIDSTAMFDSIKLANTAFAKEFAEYAKTFIGVPYVWGSANPSVGLDCSGFVNAVAKKFEIKVPRSSASFTNLGNTVSLEEAEAGDIILFTGTDPKKKIVGHMGIVTSNEHGDIEFIHSSSGKKRGVNISSLTGYYKTRFVKIIRIFPLNEDRVVS